MQLALFYSFLTSLFGISGWFHKRSVDKEENPKDVYRYRELPPQEIHPTRNLINQLREEIKINKGVWTDSNIRKLNELRGKLRTEEPNYIEDILSGLRIEKTIMPDTKLEYSTWKRYITKEIKQCMDAEIPMRNVA